MLLAIDIGNTNISIGVFRNDILIKRYSIPTKDKRRRALFKKIFAKYKIDDAIASSVVPRSTAVLEAELNKILRKKPLIIGRDIIVPVVNIYRKPGQVGSDRLVNAYAGIKLYGAPLIIVDFGTAITFDAVSRNKEYLGGMILPGLGISLDALTERTALLPKVKLERPGELVARDTKNSILSGIVYGFGALTDSLIEKIRAELGPDAKAAGTGGNINFMAGYCRKFDIINMNLTLVGLSLIYRARKERS